MTRPRHVSFFNSLLGFSFDIRDVRRRQENARGKLDPKPAHRAISGYNHGRSNAQRARCLPTPRGVSQVSRACRSGSWGGRRSRVWRRRAGTYSLRIGTRSCFGLENQVPTKRRRPYPKAVALESSGVPVFSAHENVQGCANENVTNRFRRPSESRTPGRSKSNPETVARANLNPGIARTSHRR